MSTTWTTKTGQTYQVPELSDQHLVNILKMLFRQVKQLELKTEVYMFCPEPRGEMAQIAFWEELDFWLEHGSYVTPATRESFLSQNVSCWAALKEEARQRQVKVMGQLTEKSIYDLAHDAVFGTAIVADAHPPEPQLIEPSEVSRSLLYQATGALSRLWHRVKRRISCRLT